MKNYFKYLLMPEPGEEEDTFFEILRQPYTFPNILFTLTEFLFSMGVLILYLPFFLMAIALTPLLIGIPMLSYLSTTVWEVVRLEKYFADLLTGSNIPLVKPPFNPKVTIFTRIKHFFLETRNLKLLLFPLLRFPIALAGLLPTLIFSGLTFLITYTPINAMFGHIELFGILTTDSFVEVIFLFFVCIILWIGMLHLIKMSVRLQVKWIKGMIGR